MVIYAAAMVPRAPDSFDVALLVFTGIAAIVGWLGLLVSFLSYRLEAGRVPRPDISLRSPDGSFVPFLNLEIHLAEPETSFEHEIDRKRDELFGKAAEIQRGSRLLAGSLFMSPSKEDFARYNKEVEKYLKRYASYLKARSTWQAFWKRSFRLVIGFSNAKAGVPATGIQAALHFPEDDGISIASASELPEEPQGPEAPSVPQPFNPLAAFANISVPRWSAPPIQPLDFRPPGNVSGPEIGKGSIQVMYQINELLHNTTETTEEDPIILTFSRYGKWVIPYEVHARNLPTPRRGSFTIVAAQAEPSLE